MRGKSSSTLNRSERLERSYELFAKGYSQADVARKLAVHKATAAAYKRRYEAQLQDQVKAHPDLLNDVLGNALRILTEGDYIRKDVWKYLAKRKPHVCENCMENCGCDEPLPPSAVIGYHNTLLKAQEQRMKVFGLLGVRQEYFIKVQQIEALQRQLLDFMATNLCLEDRARLEQFLGSTVGELAQASVLPVIDVMAESDVVVV